MDDVAIKHDASVGHSWPFQIYKTLKEFGVAQISYVPDAGHAELIELSHGDRAIQTTVLTTEEEGVALSACSAARNGWGHTDGAEFHTRPPRSGQGTAG